MARRLKLDKMYSSQSPPKQIKQIGPMQACNSLEYLLRKKGLQKVITSKQPGDAKNRYADEEILEESR